MGTNSYQTENINKDTDIETNKKNWRKEIQSNIIITGEFNAVVSVMDRISNLEKKISK